MKDIIQTQLTAADRAAIETLLGNLEAAFAGKTATIDETERSRYGSVNEQNKLVINKARDFRTSQPARSSPEVDWTEFESDYQSRSFLENTISRLKSLIYSLESTKMMHDYDNLQDALRDYSYSQYKHGAGEEGYSTKIDEYKQFFAKSPPKETVRRRRRRQHKQRRHSINRPFDCQNTSKACIGYVPNVSDTFPNV